MTQDQSFTRPHRSIRSWRIGLVLCAGIALLWVCLPSASARQNIRDAFFTVYPDAELTVLGTHPLTAEAYCGVCHYEFSGGGARNAYGQRLENELPNHGSNPNGRRAAVMAIETEDPDGDGFSTLVEVTDVVTIPNTPTFPGLAPADIVSVTGIDTSLIQDALVPAADTGNTVTIYPTKDVTLYDPNGDKANGMGDYVFSGNTNGAGLRRAVFHFDIAAHVPAGVTIESATLNLHMSRTISGGHLHTLHVMTQDWGEGASHASGEEGDPDSAQQDDATWIYRFYDENNPDNSPPWNTPGGDFLASISASASVGGVGNYAWSSPQLTADVQMWLDTPGTNFGWILLGNEGQETTAKRFDSVQNNNSNNWPRLVITYGAPATPPDVTVLSPNGSEVITANEPVTVQWDADDESGIAGIDLYVSNDGGATFRPIAIGLSDTGSYQWFPANRPATNAVFRVVATDMTFDTAQDDSDGFFTVNSPPGGIVPSTLRDFDMPGSQPFEAGILNPPIACAPCHGNYDQAVEPYFNWQGSMMSLASLDPLFEANLAIANQDAPDSGDLCLRCHISRGWLQGRSIPTDGSQILESDRIGVSCDLCHRLVDPIYEPGASPIEDFDILAALSMPASTFANAMYTVDPTGARRGPFVDAASGHPILVSPFHREAALCGTCHDVSNPAFEKVSSNTYLPNTFDEMSGSVHSHVAGPVERTYSEWFYSEYNTQLGVFAPQFGGNLDFVSTCQDCHMRDVTGQGCNLSPPVRNDLPLHDMTGGSTWLPPLIAAMHPDTTSAVAVDAGVIRARYMLQNAAELQAMQVDGDLVVTVTNNTGHKLPTGYPEGRRIWLNIQFFDEQMNLVGESGAYDPATGVLTQDAAVKIYEVKPGMDENVAPLAGELPGPSFHFVLNNKTYKDNRIPPRGFTNANYDQFGGLPVGATYADGQYWDDTLYMIPPAATTAMVTLYYQSTSKEFVEFLLTENVTDNAGQAMYDLWNTNGKCPPELMATVSLPVIGGGDCPADFDNDGQVGTSDFFALLQNWGDCPADPDPCPWDITGDDGVPDGVIGTDDFFALLQNWGPCE